jgi:hypothetical protein
MQPGSNPSPEPNSLITGKITGNFAESGLPMRFSNLIHERIQELAAKFPTQRNREFFCWNREEKSFEQGVFIGKLLARGGPHATITSVSMKSLIFGVSPCNFGNAGRFWKNAGKRLARAC